MGSEFLALADGRTLVYEQFGDPDGTPVFFQHGTGDSRLARHPDEGLTSELGIRLLTVDRPGVGGSSPRPHRTLLEWAPDIEALADHLGVAAFAVAGWSGGGPHALAIAMALGDRVTQVALASSLTSFDQPGSRDLVENKDLRTLWKLQHLKFAARLGAKIEAKEGLKDISAFIDKDITDVAPADAGVMNDPALRPMFEAEMAEAMAQSGVGALDDMWAFLDWGFRPEDVTQHVELFHAEQDQILGVGMMARLAARLPNAESHLWSDGGHYQVFAQWQPFLQTCL